ncbi:MAG: amidohydrolase, partial [Actinobacteria bacterium]|nr:amidohydrolase [Actinomycetota bacterium]
MNAPVEPKKFAFAQNILPAIEKMATEMVDVRHQIHAHPELAFEEHATSDMVATRLKEWGYEVHRGLAGTGVVGTLKRGNGKLRLGIRADMDALPIQENTGLPYASQHPGKMHACGHDGHTAMLLGAAQYLSNHRDFKGTVIFIFQPAEEGGAGAQEMIEDGLFEQFPCDAVFGMHNWPGLEEGHFGVVSGPMMASSNEFVIDIQGKGGHAALPHNSADPIMAGIQIAQALQTIITRNKRPVDAAVISITQFHAGETSNVIPDTAMLGGTVRTFTLEVLDLIETRMHEIANQVASAFDCKANLTF